MSLGLSDDASHQLNFYNSLRYDTSTGSTKVVDDAPDGTPSSIQGKTWSWWMSNQFTSIQDTHLLEQ